MKPLSSISYIIGNSKKYFSVFVGTMLGVFLVYFIGVLIYSGIEELKRFNLYSYNCTFVDSGNGIINDDDLIIMQNDENLKALFPVGYSNIFIRVNNSFGTIKLNEMTMFKEDIYTVLENDNLEIEGRLPENSKDEVIMHEDIAKQIGVGIGDNLINNENKDVKVDKDYKIVGLIRGYRKIIITCNVGDITREDAKKQRFMYYLKDSKNTILNDKIREMLPKGIFLNYNMRLIEINSTIKAYEFLYLLVVILMISVISITLKNLNKINLINRMDELTILNSMGYSKPFLISKVFKENALTILFGVIVGVPLSVGIFSIINTVVWLPKGKVAYLFLLKPILASIIVPILNFILSILSSIGVIYKINK